MPRLFYSLVKITAEKLETSTQSRDTNRIAELTQELEERKKVLERTTTSSETLCNDWKTKLNPVWIVSGKVGGASLSLAQILLWSALVFSASFYVWVVSGKLLDLTSVRGACGDRGRTAKCQGNP